MIVITYIVLVSIFTCNGYKSPITIDDHPSLWPGHLEPFGSNQKTISVQQISEWPSPIDFFKDYVEGNKPILFKGLAKRSPAQHLWDDKYLMNKATSQKQSVVVEPEKKENRVLTKKEMMFHEFLKIYKNQSVYMVNPVPKAIQKDVLMPAPLRCDETRQYMEHAMTWFSSGDTKSVLHHDDLDNINCLLRGSKQLLLIEYNANRNYVPIDMPGYSSVDVDKVDYVKYPNLRKVNYYVKANMEEGDCIFIPYKWFHQVNSKANSKKQNIAVNVFFRHLNKHRPNDCSVSPYDATLDLFEFRQHLSEPKEEDASLADHYQNYLKRTKKNRANFVTFLSIYKRDPTITERDITHTEFPVQYDRLMNQLFLALDVNENGFIEVDDFKAAAIDQETFNSYMENLHAKHEKLLIFLDNFLFYYKDKRPTDEL